MLSSEIILLLATQCSCKYKLTKNILLIIVHILIQFNFREYTVTASCLFPVNTAMLAMALVACLIVTILVRFVPLLFKAGGRACGDNVLILPLLLWL